MLEIFRLVFLPGILVVIIIAPRIIDWIFGLPEDRGTDIYE